MHISITQLQTASAAVFLFALIACQHSGKETTQAAPPAADTIRMPDVPKTGAAIFDITKGVVRWTGKKALGATHEGTINVENGALTVKQNTLLDGKVVLDMHSLVVTDIQDAGERRDLESHLKDADFFQVDQFPQATFTFKQVLPGGDNPNFNAVIVGDLTMRDKTNPVNIPVKLQITGDKLSAVSPTFPIDRTKWGVNFRSSLLNTAKDKLIEDNVLLSLNLEAQKRK